jgi:hypothetical protein
MNIAVLNAQPVPVVLSQCEENVTQPQTRRNRSGLRCLGLLLFIIGLTQPFILGQGNNFTPPSQSVGS